MTTKFRTLALAAMSLGAALSVQAAAVGFEDLAAQALANTEGGAFPQGRPLNLVPGSSQVPGFSFTGATVYHVAQTIASSRPGPTDPSHTGFIQSRAANNTVNREIEIELAQSQAGGDIESIDFNLSTNQTLIRLWAYDTAGAFRSFDFGNTSEPAAWEWISGSKAFADLGAVNRIKFENLGGGAFALDDLNFTLANTGGGTVPEPAGLGLVALALAAVGLTTRKRRA